MLTRIYRILCGMAMLPCLLFGCATAGENAMTTSSLPNSIYEVPILAMQKDGGTTATLAPYKGKVLLLVNVASQCGFTKQYGALEAVYREYKERGLVVVGLPANDFGGQEPGTEEEIVKFCSTKYDVTFPLMAKSHAKGAEIAPIFAYLTQSEHTPSKGGILWNFEKFLISRDGKIIDRWRSITKPDSKDIKQAIEKALAETPAP